MLYTPHFDFFANKWLSSVYPILFAHLRFMILVGHHNFEDFFVSVSDDQANVLCDLHTFLSAKFRVKQDQPAEQERTIIVLASRSSFASLSIGSEQAYNMTTSSVT